jgi:hypothetical protein
MLAPLLIYGLGACDCRRHDADKENKIADGNVSGAGANVVTGFSKTLRTSDGRIYDNVKLVRSEPDGLLIMYHGPASKGMTKLEYTALPEDIRRMFNYDRNKAEQFKSDRRDKARKAMVKKPTFTASIMSSIQAGLLPPDSDANATPEQTATGLLMCIAAEIDEITKLDPAAAEEIRMFYTQKHNITNLEAEIPASAR